jgi:threonine/homoserine/homoserine lactone efflux protein
MQQLGAFPVLTVLVVLAPGPDPKIGVFFTSFLPQFVAPGSPVLPLTLALGVVFATIGLAWLLVHSVLATRLAHVLRRRAARRWLERVTGAVPIGFGVRLAIERR